MIDKFHKLGFALAWLPSLSWMGIFVGIFLKDDHNFNLHSAPTVFNDLISEWKILSFLPSSKWEIISIFPSVSLALSIVFMICSSLWFGIAVIRSTDISKAWRFALIVGIIVLNPFISPVVFYSLKNHQRLISTPWNQIKTGIILPWCGWLGSFLLMIAFSVLKPDYFMGNSDGFGTRVCVSALYGAILLCIFMLAGIATALVKRKYRLSAGLLIGTLIVVVLELGLLALWFTRSFKLHIL